MPLLPKAKEFLEQLVAAGMPPLGSQSPAETRLAFDAIATFGGPPEPMAKIEERRVPGPAGEIPLRVYTPEAASPLPVLVYFHGGGWVIGNFETHDAVCRLLAKSAPAIVASVDYRLAPEHKFPAAAEDCYAATRWVAENAAAIGGAAEKLAVGGDSAGGNLAAVVSLMARDRKTPKIGLQLLVYPVTAHGYDTASYRENADGYLLTKDAMVWFWNHYLTGQADGENAYASPLRAKDLRGLPPALVVTAEFDPLRDEGESYAKRLEEAGVPVTLKRYDGIIHGFFTMCGVFDQAREAVSAAAAEIRKL
ncbi:MAG: alpha/beta hydrolase [Candidatus Binatia bacterium]